MWAGVVFVFASALALSGSAATAARPGTSANVGEGPPVAAASAILYLEKTADPRPNADLDGDAAIDDAICAVAESLQQLTALPDAFESGAGLTGLRRAAARALWQPGAVKVSVFGALEHADGPMAGQLDALQVIFEFPRGRAAPGLAERIAGAITGSVNPPVHQWQHVTTSVEDARVIVALGSGAIAHYQALSSEALRASVLRDHAGVRAPRDGRRVSGAINLEAARVAWPAALGFGPSGRVLRAWSIGNLRSVSIDAVHANAGVAVGPAALALRLATSARSDPIGREHPFEVQLPTTRGAVDTESKRSRFLLSAEWGPRIRLGLRTAAVLAKTGATGKSTTEIQLDEAIRRFGASMGATITIEPAAPDAGAGAAGGGGVGGRGGRPVFIVRSPLRSADSRDNAIAAITAMTTANGAQRHIRPAKTIKNGWVFTGQPTPLCEQAAWCITPRQLVAVLDLGDSSEPFDLEQALASAIADGGEKPPP